MEINLLKKFPSIKRDLTKRVSQKSELEKAIARQFDRDFFDGDRKHGYGGYHYHPKFWQGVVEDLRSKYHLNHKSKVLDVGCAKGFLLYDLVDLIPGIYVQGLDISYYAVSNAQKEIKDSLQVGDARALPYQDNSFDLVLSLNTLHNFEGPELIKAIQEIQRVSKGQSYITVDAYRTEQQKKQLFDWVLTAKSILHVEEWKSIFKQAGYTGDYYWFGL